MFIKSLDRHTKPERRRLPFHSELSRSPHEDGGPSPLNTKPAEEVTYHLVDFFCDKGSPHVLQSDNGMEFANKVCQCIIHTYSQR